MKMAEVTRFGAGGVPYVVSTPSEPEPIDWRKVPAAEMLTDLSALDADEFVEKYNVNKATVRKGGV